MTRGTIRSEWNPTIGAFGTTYAAPYRSPMELLDERLRLAAYPTHAEETADQIIKDWQGAGELKIDYLRLLIISALQDDDE